MSPKSTKCTFEQLNDELNQFYDYLKRKNRNDNEIRAVFAPLTTKLTKKRFFEPYCLLSVVIFAIILYLLSYTDYFSWVFSAIGRIFLIKMLPYYDWKHLKYEQCLIPSPQDWFSKKTASEKLFNCDLCENIQKIDSFRSLDEDEFQEKYIELHIPAIMTRGIDHWKNFTKAILEHDDFYYSRPCSLSSNIINDEMVAGRILERAQNFDSFFLHFQNCEKEAIKIFRTYTYRPDYLPELLSPILCNWIVWNKAYNTTNFKTIALVENVAIFGQVIGKTHIKLLPRKNCEFECPVLHLELNAGESVFFTSLWDIEYRPGENGENLAAILELRN